MSKNQECPKCSGSMVYNKDSKIYICQDCGYEIGKEYLEVLKEEWEFERKMSQD